VRAVAAVIAMLALAAPATAAESFNALEQQFMCVSCNVALNIAESPQAEQERGVLHRLIDQGLTKEQIKARMVAVYGDNVLAQPKGSGFNLFAWLIPIGAAGALISLGLFLLPRWRRRDKGGDDDDGPTGPPLDPADAARVDADMARLGV
jgi:cytochrome c-type biogenesis protein CcmH